MLTARLTARIFLTLCALVAATSVFISMLGGHNRTGFDGIVLAIFLGLAAYNIARTIITIHTITENK